VWSFDRKILAGKKTHVPGKARLDATLSTNPTWTDPGSNPVLLGV
jgi:hypothetical protein